jgi:stage II sporulation protein AB (anti-sigma F factor)
MKKIINEMKLRLLAKSENEAVARAVVSAFVASANPQLSELSELRLAVSEAVTNSVVHGYKAVVEGRGAYIYISLRLYDTREVSVEISDNGCGIADIALARTPAYTTGSEDGGRCGMGFLLMESSTDSLVIRSSVGRGTTVLMRKYLKPILRVEDEK